MAGEDDITPLDEFIGGLNAQILTGGASAEDIERQITAAEAAQSLSPDDAAQVRSCVASALRIRDRQEESSED